jgi:hypothetical protein
MNMPQDNQFDYKSWYQQRWYDRACWEVEFALWPRRCAITNNLIWLKRGYCGELWITGPGEPVVLTRWHDRHEHLLWLLKG